MSSDETTTTGFQTWSVASRIVLTVTPEGRVVPGDGMQMDDVAREFLSACDVYAANRDAENARLRERVAVLTKALRTVAECRGGGAWYCKSGVADAALSQADETGGAR